MKIDLYFFINMILLIPDIFRSIVYYLNFHDLINLMSMSIEFRNYIGLSNNWKYLDMDIPDNLLKFLGSFQMPIELNVYYKQRKYYSSWYYLYIIKKYFRNCNYSPNIYTSINNTDELFNMALISSSFLEDYGYDYLAKCWHIVRNIRGLDTFDHPDKDKILKTIHLSSSCVVEKCKNYSANIKYTINYKYSLSYDTRNFGFIYAEDSKIYKGIELNELLKYICKKLSINQFIFTKILLSLFSEPSSDREKLISILYMYKN